MPPVQGIFESRASCCCASSTPMRFEECGASDSERCTLRERGTPRTGEYQTRWFRTCPSRTDRRCDAPTVRNLEDTCRRTPTRLSGPLSPHHTPNSGPVPWSKTTHWGRICIAQTRMWIWYPPGSRSSLSPKPLRAYLGTFPRGRLHTHRAPPRPTAC